MWFDGLDIQEIVEHLKRSRARSDEADQNTVRECLEVELHSDIWQKARETSHVTFAVFLQRMGVCTAEWYLRRKAVFVDTELVVLLPVVGLAALALAAEVQDKAKRDNVIRSLIAAAQNRGGPLPDRTARDVVSNVVGGKIRVSRKTELEIEYDKIVKENRQLKKEIERLKKEIERLQAFNGRLSQVVS